MPRKQLSRSDWRTNQKCQNDLAAFDGVVMVSVSGGSASAVAWKRCLERYGADRVIPVFADTRSEADDTYRFLDECEKAFGQPLVRLDQGKDIWDCFEDEGIMRLPKGGCKASLELKRKPLDAYFAECGADAIAYGFNFDEGERIRDKIAANPDAIHLFPLVAKPRLSSCQIHDELKRWGIEPVNVYADGFLHNNCYRKGGCVLAGLGQWAAMLRLNPEGYAIAEKRGDAFFERTGFTALKDQRGDESTPLTFADFRERVEAGEDFGNQWNSMCGCMSPELFTMDELTAVD